MIKKIFLFFCLPFLIPCHAQLINTKPVDIYTGPINFNSQIIKEHKIKSIALYIVDKPDGDVIVDKQAGQGYEFDSNGKMIRYYYTILSKTKYNQPNENKNNL